MADLALTTALPVRYDETRRADGSESTGWRTILSRLEALSAEEQQIYRHEIDLQLRGNGIAYNPLANESHVTRPWELDLVPMVFEEDDWQRLARGLEQRARLKLALLDDIYGARRVLLDSIVPPTLIFAHEGYQRDAYGLPIDGNLPMVTVDVSRSPSGDWYAVEDQCQFPAGVGYTLENRLVLSRVFPKLFRDCRVQRIAGYFRTLQQAAVNRMDRDSRCVLLGYGVSHPHYFEYAWLAKYLGYTLVQPADLSVRNESVFLKTVAGLQRVHLILRFVEDRHLDPLAVGNVAGEGIPGLFQAVRAGAVRIINPLGAGVLDNPALNAYLPAICQHLLDEPLQLLSAPTYWLGDQTQRDHVLGRFDELLIRDIGAGAETIDTHQLGADDRRALMAAIDRIPERFTAQERIDRSIAPSIEGRTRVSRQITVRSFLVDAGEGYELMAGGLCLLDTQQDGSRSSFDSLAGSKDVWVLSSTPVVKDTLLRSRTDELDYAMLEGELPSRVAENLFWLGRNAERVESSLRQLRSICAALQDDDSPIDALDKPAVAAQLRAISVATGTLPGFAGRGGARRLARPDRELQSLLHDKERFGTLANNLQQLQLSATAIRDRVSPEIIRVLNRLEDETAALGRLPRWRHFSHDAEALNRTLARLDELVMSMSALSGLASDNLTHGDSWRFLTLGRRIERAQQSAVILRTLLAGAPSELDLLERTLTLFDSVMTYRSRYRSRIDLRLLIDLLVLDETNPRSLAYQFHEIDYLIQRLPARHRVRRRDPLQRTAIAALSRVRLADAETLVEEGSGKRQTLGRFLEILERFSLQLGEQLTDAYFAHVETRRQLADAELGSEPDASEAANAPIV